jgi:putative serine protease PepD
MVMNVKPAALVLLSAAALAGGGAGAVVATTRDPQTRTATTTVTSTTTGAVIPAAATTTTTTRTAGEIYKSASAGVVDLVVHTSQGDAEGSGFVTDAKGDIVTNAHVISGATSIRVTFADGTKATAELVAQDRATDLAVVRVAGVAASKLHPLTLADSGSVSVGDAVLAIGSPFGLSETLTTGIVSGLHRTIQSPSGATIGGAIQTDASINHGNSGGPLLDTQGRVIGVNAQIESDSGGNDGVGFAIASDTVRTVVTALAAGEQVQHAQLGVRIQDASTAGVKLAGVTSGGAAAAAGLKAGDVITALDGTPVADSDALAAVVAAHQPGDHVHVAFRRAGAAAQTVTVTLGKAA